MPLGDRIGWFAVVLIGAQIALLGWPYLVFVAVLGLSTLWVTRKVAHRASERQYRARLIADCDRQHREVMAGQVIIPPIPMIWPRYEHR